jgi:hypothetical protein
MLPLGIIELGRHATHFTPDEQRVVMTLWSIARSPLMFGGDMNKLDPFTLSLLTNDEVLAVDQASARNRPLFDRDGRVAWTADVPGSADRYLAVFNTGDSPAAVAVDLGDLGLGAGGRVRDLWSHTDLGATGRAFAPTVAAHGAGLYRIMPGPQ